MDEKTSNKMKEKFNVLERLFLQEVLELLEQVNVLLVFI